MSTYRTNQEIFDTVVRHLLRQGVQSLANPAEPNICAYHAPDGLRCAVGALIDDDYYYPGLEGCPACNAGVMRAARAAPASEQLLLDLQAVHDDAEPFAWRECLEAVALRHGLTMPTSPFKIRVPVVSTGRSKVAK